MPVRRARKTISRPAGRCPRRRAPMWPRLAPVDRRRCDRRHDHSRRRGAVLDRSVVVSVAPAESSRATAPAVTRPASPAVDRPSSAEDWTALAPQSDGLFVALSPWKSAAMSRVGLDRAAGGLWRRFECWRGEHRNTTNGRQDKSAAFGRAHVVGWVEISRHHRHPPCWRFCRNVNDFNAPSAVAGISRRRLSHDDARRRSAVSGPAASGTATRAPSARRPSSAR